MIKRMLYFDCGVLIMLDVDTKTQTKQKISTFVTTGRHRLQQKDNIIFRINFRYLLLLPLLACSIW